MKDMKICTLVVLILLTALPVKAESILVRRYTSDKLDKFWRATLGATAPQKTWFEMLAPDSDTGNPVRDVEEAANDHGVPVSGEVYGDTASSTATTRRIAFPVIRLGAEDAAILMRRLAWSELFLNRYRFIETVSTDNAETRQTLTARQYSAGLEAYLITARLYYSAPDVQQKCMRLKRLGELSNTLSGMSDNSPLVDWRPLVAIQKATEQRLEDSQLTQLVCDVKPVRSKGEMKRYVKTLVDERILQEVKKEVVKTLKLLRESSDEFQKLVKKMNVPIKYKNILELERNLGNAQANMMLVKEDQLKAADTITKLKEVTDVQLSSLNKPEGLQDFQNGQKSMADLVKLIDEVLTALADLDQLSDDADIAEKLSPCAQLRTIYKEFVFEPDTHTLRRKIIEPYEDCIAGAAAVVPRFQKPSLQKTLMAELAAHVRQISEAYLRSIEP